MLTKTDLSEIQKIVQLETKKAVQSETPGIVRGIVQQELKPVKKDILAIKKDINLIVRTFDRDYTTLRKKVEHIEHRFPLTPLATS
jgi:hypothetical protein